MKLIHIRNELLEFKCEKCNNEAKWVVYPRLYIATGENSFHYYCDKCHKRD